MMTQIELNALNAQVRVPQELTELNETAKSIADSLRGIANSLNILATLETYKVSRQALLSDDPPFVIRDGIVVPRSWKPEDME